MAYRSGRCLLRERLKEANMTQKQLSQKVGISEQQVSDYVNNRRPTMSLDNAMTIAKAIGCRIEQLYEWEEVRRSPGRQE